MSVKKRVYYLSGFDPRGPAFYHRLFREESRKSTHLNGSQINTAKRKTISKLVSQWSVEADWNGQSCSTDYRFLCWDDIIRAYWISSVWMLMLAAMPMYWLGLKCRVFPRFRKAGRGPYICSIYPLVFIVAVFICAFLSAFLVGFGVYSFFTNVVLGAILSIIAAALAAFILIQSAIKLGEKLGIWWILQTYLFVARWSVKPLPELEVRMIDFAETIAKDQVESPADEILLVGHCVGTMLSVSVLNHMINHHQVTLKNKLTLITLGQCIPYLSFVPSATHFRTSLEQVVNNEVFPWLDFGARADPLCFQQLSPAVADGMSVRVQNRPVQYTVRPYHMFAPDKYKTLKKSGLRIHFQYLMTADLPTDYDYFALTTRPNYLASIL